MHAEDTYFCDMTLLFQTLYPSYRLVPFFGFRFKNIYRLSQSQNIFLVKCSVAFLFSYSSSRTNKYLSEQFYSDEKINSYMYTGAIEFIFAIICMQIT